MPRKAKKLVGTPPTSGDDDVFDSDVEESARRREKFKQTKTKEKKRRSMILNTTSASAATWEGPDSEDEDESPASPIADAGPNRQTPLASGSGISRTSSATTTGAGTDAEMASLGMTNEEIVTHYSNCLRLAAESKINSKNAFHLQLIDVMGLVMKTREKEGQGANRFQYASCALDASAKIYAVRVDTVYGDTMNTVATMTKLRAGGVVNDNDNDDDPQLGDDGNPLPRVKPKTRKRPKMGSSLEKNKENLLITQKELVSDVVSYGRIQIDEGRLGVGVFLPIANPADDFQCLQLNERAKFVGSSFRTEEEKTREKAFYGALKDQNWALNSDAIFEAGGDLAGDQEVLNDSELDDFNWHWNAEEVNGRMDDDDETLMEADDFRFNADKPVELPVPDDVPDDMDLPEPFEDNFTADDGDVPFAEDFELQRSHGRDRFADDPMIADNPSSMSTEPRDYAYFDKEIMRVWSGTGKWLRLAKQRGNPRLALIAAGIEEKKPKKPRKKKVEYVIPDWDHSLSPRANMAGVAAYFTVGKVVAEWPDKVISTWKKANLPTDHKITAKDSYSYFYKNRDFTTECRDFGGRQYYPEGFNPEDGDYNYDNPNDRSFCVNAEEDGGDDVGPAGGGGGGDGLPDDDDDDMPPPESNIMDVISMAGAAQGALVGDNLVARPDTVPTINIKYDKIAKRIDMRRLKGTLWMLITKQEDMRLRDEYEQKKRENPGLSSDEEPQYGRSIGEFEMKFSTAYNQLGPKLPEQMAKDLTPHLAFAAMLHLVNEKELFLVGQDDCSDFVIRKWKVTDGNKAAPAYPVVLSSKMLPAAS